MTPTEYLDQLDQAHASGARVQVWSFDALVALKCLGLDHEPAELIVAAVNALPKLTAALRAVEALADTWDARHSGWCCTQSCPEPDERHPDPTDPVRIEELAGAWSDNPPPLVEHRTIPCPGTCTCQVGPYITSIRAAIAAALSGAE